GPDILDQQIIQVRQQDSNKINARLLPSPIPSRILRRHADQRDHAICVRTDSVDHSIASWWTTR
ncbi:hypothetical protein AB4305_33395, partial [Nocardia sp. 2YAB30]|uniref:hypothetical protein n=1 Tax=Nocardia sp. 2YAB30 TaxID=3233022 RepID=UPI003F96EDB0